MSLSLPARFPVLKLPFLCIESVIKSWETFDIIYFALLSKRTRRIVKHLKIPLNNIKIYLSNMKWINFVNFSKMWHFRKLQKQEVPLYASKTHDGLESCSDENEITAVKMAMEFLNEVFKCSVQTVEINGDNLPESGDIGVRSSTNLCIYYPKSGLISHAYIRKMNALLENLEVTDACTFDGFPGRDFHYETKLLKCKRLIFWSRASLKVTRDILLQLKVPRLYFGVSWLTKGDIVSFVTHWFHSDNRKFEYLYILSQRKRISLEAFQTKDLNPVQFNERSRNPIPESFVVIDFSNGLEIVRHDGLRATIHFTTGSFLFYVWHDQ